jgi:hypothetical protein
MFHQRSAPIDYCFGDSLLAVWRNCSHSASAIPSSKAQACKSDQSMAWFRATHVAMHHQRLVAIPGALSLPKELLLIFFRQRG